MRFGIALEDLDAHLDPDLLAAVGSRGLGFDHCHKFVDLSKIWPAEDRFNFDKLDADVQTIRNAGMDVGLRLLWCPRHASGGQPAYLEYAQGCTVMEANGRARFAAEHAFCLNPPHIDAAKMTRLGSILGARVGRFVSWWSVWNEPGGDLYWPPVHGGTDVDGAFERLVHELVDPITDGVKSVEPNAVFIGCEAQGGDEFRRLLEKCGDLWTYYTCHRYLRGDGGLAEFHNEMNFYAVVLRNWGQNAVRGKMWLTEAGDEGNGSRLIELAREAAARYDDLLYGISYYVRPDMWGMWLDRLPNGTYRLNAQGRAMQEYIAQQRPRIATGPRRRRAVGGGAGAGVIA